MITIAGGGFGLYGYLPAIIESNFDKVVLPEKYRQKIEQRPDLRRYCEMVNWVKDEFTAYSVSNSIILTLPPTEQKLLLEVLLSGDENSITKFYLEKPLAANPGDAKNIVRSLIKLDKQFSIGYTLLFCTWFEPLRQYVLNCKGSIDLRLDWNFKAFFIENDPESWKANESAGGGVLNFYGIHILALLLELGFSKIEESNLSGLSGEKPLRWQARFKNDIGALFFLDINCNVPEQLFAIRNVKGSDKYSISLKTPFDMEPQIGEQDKRVAVMVRYLQSSFDMTTKIRFYENINDLWQTVINISSFSKSNIECRLH